MTNEELITHGMSYIGNEVNCLRHNRRATIIKFDMITNDGCVWMIGVVPNDMFRYTIEIYNPSVGWAEMNPPLITKETELVKNNILIADYMGYPKHHDHYHLRKFNYYTFSYNTTQDFNQLCFHLSWDWLMPVLDKIMATTDDQTKAFEGLNIFELGLGTDLTTIYIEIINFINWYNENKDIQ